MEDCIFAPQTKWSVQKKIDRRAHQNASNTVTAYQNEPNNTTSLGNETVSENFIHYEINENNDKHNEHKHNEDKTTLSHSTISRYNCRLQESDCCLPCF